MIRGATEVALMRPNVVFDTFVSGLLKIAELNALKNSVRSSTPAASVGHFVRARFRRAISQSPCAGPRIAPMGAFPNPVPFPSLPITGQSAGFELLSAALEFAVFTHDVLKKLFSLAGSAPDAASMEALHAAIGARSLVIPKTLFVFVPTSVRGFPDCTVTTPESP